MASSAQTVGGKSRAGRIIGPSLDRIIKNVPWRKHSNLVASCKSALDKLQTLVISDPNVTDISTSLHIHGLSESDADFVIGPIFLALDTNSPKLIEPALDCLQKLFSHGVFRGEVEPGEANLAGRLVEGVCKCDGSGDDAIEIGVIRVVIAAVRSRVVLLKGECLVDLVKSLCNVCLGSHSISNRVCAKSVLVQLVLIVFRRVEIGKMEVEVDVVQIEDILDLSDKSLNDSTVVNSAQGFIREVMGGNAVDESELLRLRVENGKADCEDSDLEIVSKIREDGLFLFKNLCKFSMKFSTQENREDHLLVRGKLLSLELLKIVIDNSGQIWKTDDK